MTANTIQQIKMKPKKVLMLLVDWHSIRQHWLNIITLLPAKAYQIGVETNKTEIRYKNLIDKWLVTKAQTKK